MGPGDCAYLGRGSPGAAVAADGPGARVLLLGGEPFDEALVMWWNFVGRSGAEIESARSAWERGESFGGVDGAAAAGVAAPALVPGRLVARPPARA